jgi:hypothetical protein
MDCRDTGYWRDCECESDDDLPNDIFMLVYCATEYDNYENVYNIISIVSDDNPHYPTRLCVLEEHLGVRYVDIIEEYCQTFKVQLVVVSSYNWDVVDYIHGIDASATDMLRLSRLMPNAVMYLNGDPYDEFGIDIDALHL